MTEQANAAVTTTARSRLGHVAIDTPDLDRFRRFYEDVLGLRLLVVDHPTRAPFRRLGAFTDGDRQSVVVLACEVPGYQSGLPDDVIGRRSRVDHLAFFAAGDREFDEIVGQLVDAGASSGEIAAFGPVRSVLFVDPDGGHHNLQIHDPSWRPESTVEIVDPDLLAAVLSSTVATESVGNVEEASAPPGRTTTRPTRPVAPGTARNERTSSMSITPTRACDELAAARSALTRQYIETGRARCSAESDRPINRGSIVIDPTKFVEADVEWTCESLQSTADALTTVAYLPTVDFSRAIDLLDLAHMFQQAHDAQCTAPATTA
jgi:catechol 2,3-dioxygenase-like lactoylglutathione lyase family enzyme